MRPTLVEVLQLEEIEPDLYRGNYVYDETWRLYGGQVAAQALRAAGHTVDEHRLPHSMHAYFLRSGRADLPTVFEVHRDRDGRTYSARRVVARQQGKEIFSAIMSFAATDEGLDSQVHRAPVVARPTEPDTTTFHRLFSHEWATVEQPVSGLDLPERYWARCSDDLGDDLLMHACAIAYVSDASTGLTRLADARHAPGASIDHAVWFHVPARADEWLLHVMEPGRTAGGRGLYTGSIFTGDGALAVSLAQQQLFRPVS